MGDNIELIFKVPLRKEIIKPEEIEKKVAASINSKETESFSISSAYWGRGAPDKKYIEYAIYPNFSSRREEFHQKLSYFPEIGKVMYYSVQPLFGFGDWFGELERYAWDFKECIFWLNFFGPKQVKKMGKDRLLSAPAFKVEELKDGGMFIQAGESPFEEKKGSGCIKAKIKIAKHLGFQDYLQKERAYLEGLDETLEHKKTIEGLFK